jgi:hypothetical protein
MANLKCEYPEGCMLDLWTEVIKAKYIERQAQILDTSFCVPTEQVGGKISSVEHIMVNVLDKREEFQLNSVRIYIDFEIIMTVAVGREFKVVMLRDFYEKVINLQNFDPPLTHEEFKMEIDQSELILTNWEFHPDIKGNCEDKFNLCHISTPISGTCLGLQVYVDIIDKLGKMHDIIIYGELDLETDF